MLQVGTQSDQLGNSQNADQEDDYDMAHSPAFTSGFKARLIKTRENAGFETARDFAKHIGMDDSRYRKYERDDQQNVMPNLEALIIISDALGKSLDWLIRGKDMK